jgi:RNA polymerase sigma factor (sigma-70 family)
MSAQGANLLRHLRKLAARCPSKEIDGRLLERFLGDRDEAAFAALVQRHGAMVLGVCRGVLHHTQDAENAFQATFLVLARKARSIRKQQSVAGWLHGVAYRLALKARAELSRRRARERPADEALPARAGDDLSWRELEAILHEELHRLPDKYQAPLLLCYWEGKTRDEAAEQLGWTLGRFKDHLERARALLRGRLVRRGVAPSAALLSGLLAETAAQAAGASAGASALARAALLFADHQGPGVAAAPAVALAEGALRTMRRTQWIKALAMLFTLGLLGMGLALWAASPPSAEPDPRPQNSLPIEQKDPAKKDQEKKAERTDLGKLQGKWELVYMSEREKAPRWFKEIKDSNEIVWILDQNGKLIYRHRAEIKLGKTGEVKLFTYFNKMVEDLQGGAPTPDKGGSYIYRLEGDKFAEAHGFLTDLYDPQAKDVEPATTSLLIWQRVKE